MRLLIRDPVYHLSEGRRVVREVEEDPSCLFEVDSAGGYRRIILGRPIGVRSIGRDLDSEDKNDCVVEVVEVDGQR